MTKVTNDHLSNDDRWHSGETYVRLNSLDVSNGRPNRDGIVRGWFDGERLVGHTDAAIHGLSRRQVQSVLTGPYFGPGMLPHAHKLTICRAK